MNKRLLAAALLTLGGGAVAATPALAQTRSATVTAATATPATSVAAVPRTAQSTNAKAVPAPGSRNCIRDTGSHIPPPKGQCLPVAGNSYNQQDIQQTGATTVGGALRMLDPSVTVHGH